MHLESMCLSSNSDVNGDLDSARSVTITEFRLRNNLTVELWLLVSQVINVKKTLTDVNTEHRHEYVTCFEE